MDAFAASLAPPLLEGVTVRHLRSDTPATAHKWIPSVTWSMKPCGSRVDRHVLTARGPGEHYNIPVSRCVVGGRLAKVPINRQ